jgi:hypothetical protein
MPRQAKRDVATVSVEVPPLKKPVPAAVAESSSASNEVHARGIERPRRNCRLVATLQQTPSIQPPSLAARPIKEENRPFISSATLPPCTQKPKCQGHAAVDEYCPVSLSTRV